MAHSNREDECLPCTQCRDDEEVVTPCSPQSDQQCQCREGAFYCDSVLCRENCYRCTRCKGAVLQTCNATRDTICAPETNPEPGNPQVYWFHIILVVFVVVVMVIHIVVIVCKKRTQISQRLVSFLKQKSSEQGCHSPRSLQPNEIPQTMDPERGAPGVETAPLLEERASALAPAAGTRPEPAEDPEDGIELQVLVVRGGQAAPEQALQTCAPAARGPQAPAEASPSLESLEEEYKRMFSLENTFSDDDMKIYFAFEHSIPEKDWKMFMRLVGLKETDIEICEHENPRDLMEQHYQMLRRWKGTQGKGASMFKLMAALHKMELQTYLQNIINKLVAEKILVKRAEASN
ncbi:tumor necrosis factor receptor superfamily member 10B-like isoform X3 [Pteropus alecto]|uniref:tumor necrosis factor receptor superfamily member 10B-like isoform X3 n=1 Tax=Pteropus alecto TaxID=9402 RepID=UPI0003F12EC5|nr:tumor necrosis factor receptor superfamily member 10B-like isoform X3 [Pteropus alecto]